VAVAGGPYLDGCSALAMHSPVPGPSNSYSSSEPVWRSGSGSNCIRVVVDEVRNLSANTQVPTWFH
jgi:hypothetical protein